MKGSRLIVLGALAVEILVGDRRSYQILYVARETRQLIYSKTCLEQLQLGMALGDTLMKGDMCQVEGLGTGSKALCGCLTRSEEPAFQTVPEQLKDSRVEDMEQWIRNYYGASAFNVCEHQPLQKMTGPPLKIRTITISFFSRLPLLNGSLLLIELCVCVCVCLSVFLCLCLCVCVYV